MQSLEHPIVRRYDDARLFGATIEDHTLFLRGRYFNPVAHPKKWLEYLNAAESSYAKYGVKSAVRRAELEVTPCPSFWMVEDTRDGTLLGGMRNHGPYPTIESVWSLQEMRTHAQYSELEQFVKPLLPFGVMESKGVFVQNRVESSRAKQVVHMLLRLQIVSIDLIAACALVGTSAKHSLPMWKRGGFEVVCPHISVPYPNKNYDTVLVAHISANRKNTMHASHLQKAAEDLAAVHESLMALEAV